MANARSAWGIDIGNRALKAIKLVREGDRIRIADFDIIEHEQVLSKAGDNRDSLIETALAQFVQRHPEKNGTVAINVSGQSSFARFVKLPPVETKRIPDIVRFEAVQQIPFPLDDVEWNYQIFQTPDSPDVEVGIFAIRKEIVRHHIQHFTRVDLNVQVVQMNPLAVYNAMVHDHRIDGTTMIIDLGAENTDLIIADGAGIWMRSIPLGGNNFTETLVKNFKIDFAKAEELKRTAATSKFARQIFQAMRPVFAELAGEIQRSIGFYASVHRDARIKKIIALGSTFRLPGLQKFLEQNLQLDVERLDRIDALPLTDGKQATHFNENILSIGSAYGLALQAMGDVKITSSLLPENIRREKMWRDKTKWFAAAAALFVLGTALAGGSWYSRVEIPHLADAGLRSTIKDITDKAETLSNRWSNEVEKGGDKERQRILNIRSLANYRNIWSDLICDIYRALPAPPPAETGAADIKRIPRKQRKEIYIDQMTARYRADLGSLLTLVDPEFSRYAEAPATTGTGSGAATFFPSAAPAPITTRAPSGDRGFLITIRGTTPNEKPVDLIAEMLKQLKETAPTATCEPAQSRHYYIARAVLAARPIPLGMTKTSASGAGTLNPTQRQLTTTDYYTNEDIREDYEYVALIAVVVLEPPAKGN